MQICLVGGTFDPPHWGHVLLAETIRDELGIPKVIFVPAFIPPHKQNEKMSRSEHRVKMLQLLVEDNPGFGIDTREIDRQGISYTIDTVREFKKEMNVNSDDLAFLIGADNYVDLDTWKDPDALVNECTIIVAERPEVSLQQASKFADHVMFVDLPKIEISSTMIRHRIRDGKSIRYYVLPSVGAYIRDNKLYQ